MRACPLVLSILLLVLTQLPAVASTSVMRCENAQGSVRFTEQACAPGERQLQHTIKHNTPIQLGVKPRPEKPSTRASVRGIDTPKSSCHTGLDEQQLRRAIVRQELHAGMTQAQVTAALGRPAHISRKNSRAQYRYEPNQGKSQTLHFDEKGCLKR